MSLWGRGARRHVPDPGPAWADLAAELTGLGMWAHLPGDLAARQSAAVAEGGWPFSTPEEDFRRRAFLADGEDLAEGGVGTLLAELATALRPLGVDLVVSDEAFPVDADGSYRIRVNGVVLVLWSAQESVVDRSWLTATTRPLGLVNRLLAQAGAALRIFTVGTGGNDGWALLLDPRTVDAVRRSGLVTGDGLPELAVLDAAGTASLRP